MKKMMIILLGVLVVVIIFILLCMNQRTVDMDSMTEGECVFEYNGVNLRESLSEQDKLLLKQIFDGKKMYKDNPSCGFSDKVAVRFDDSQTFCFACDTCPIIYWEEENIYFRLEEEEKEQLYRILEKYGMFFPCV